MAATNKERTETHKSIKKLIARWIKKQETAEKAHLLLLKNRDLGFSKELRLHGVIPVTLVE